MLIILIVTMVIVSALGVGMLSLSTSASFSQLLANNQARAYYLAQSGIEYAAPIIIAANNDGQTTPITNLNNRTFTLADGTAFYLRTDNSSALYTTVESTGVVNPSGLWQAKQKMAFRIQKKASTFSSAATSKEEMVIEDDAYVDSYDSRVAPWSFATHGLDASVRTNMTSSDKLQLKNRAVVYGNLIVGPGGAPATVVKIDPNASYTGTAFAATSAAIVASVAQPPTGGTVITSLRDLKGTSQVTLSAGAYRAADDIKLSDSAKLIINGNVILYAQKKFEMINTSEVSITAGGSLTVFVSDDLRLEGKGVQTLSTTPADLTFYGALKLDGSIGCSNVSLKKNVNFYGTIYAPDAAAVISGDSDLFGAVVGKKVQVKDRGSIHYDKALGAGRLDSFVKY